MKDLYGKVAATAQSWGKNDDKEAIAKRKAHLSSASSVSNVEQWAVNKAVHYNEWANFGRKDFQPVVAAFKTLLDCFRCDACESWMYITPRTSPESLRCGCNAFNFNLKPRQK
jgi:hypothetical protein